jgi:hypothetical protein
MKHLILLICFAASCILPSLSCAGQASGQYTQLTGSTPGDAGIKTIMGIDTATSIDFIRWDLQMQAGPSEAGKFVLYLHYGMSKPNTQDFLQGGEKKKMEGRFENKGPVIHFTSDSAKFSLRRIDENVYHFLNGKQDLMQGNAGWSYSLCRVQPVSNSTILPFFHTLLLKQDTTTIIEFTGRTPCQAIAQLMNWKVSKECWKMKWIVTLKRDAQTFEAAGFIMRQTNISGERIQGKWEINKTAQGNILTLETGNNTQQLNLLIGNENVLFILDDHLKPLVGNSEFSFTLNRK